MDSCKCASWSYPIELVVVRRMLGEMIRYLIELLDVRSLLEGL